MKKIFLFLFAFLFLSGFSFAQVEVFSSENLFGLREIDNQKNEKIIVEPKYSKLIKLKDKSFLCLYKNKYGIIDLEGNYLLEPEYNNAQRYFGRFVRLQKGNKYGLWNELGQNIIKMEYSSIEVLFGKMFLVSKNFKYGLISFDGVEILKPVADDIYMPKPTVMRIYYNGVWYEIENKRGQTLELPNDLKSIKDDKNFNVSTIVLNPIATTGYGVVSASDYFIKVFSSISPTYEETIDELILDYGADTATILLKSSWLVRFPFVYAKNYWGNVKSPNNGPFSGVKNSLKNKID